MESPPPNINPRIDVKKPYQSTKKNHSRQEPPPTTACVVAFPPLPAIKPPPTTKATTPNTLLIGAMATPLQPPSAHPRPAAQDIRASSSRLPRMLPRASPAAIALSPSNSRTVCTASPSKPPPDVPSIPRPTVQHASQAIPSVCLVQALRPAQAPHTHMPSTSPMDNTPKEHSTSSMASAFLGKTTASAHEILGKTCVSFRKEDKFRFLSKLKFMIVAKFSHLRPKYDDFLDFLKSLKFLGYFDIVAYNMKHVFVSFNVFEDFAKLWMLKSVVVKGFPIRFFQWDCDFHPTIESFVSPVWIHLPDIPVFLLDEDAIITISMAFGKPLYIDPRNLSHKLMGRLSFCVAMDVREVRKDSIWIEFIGEGIHVERFSQKVEYGVVPSFCQSCAHLGHMQEECKLALPTDLRELIDAKKKIVVQSDFQDNIPVVSVFKRLSCLGASTSGKELEGSSTALGRNLEDVEVEDITNEEELDLENQNSASIAVQEPPLKQHNSLGGENGEKAFGFLEKGVQNVKLSRRFEALSAVEEEITAVENGFLQENSANSVEEATLQGDFSQLKQDLQVIPSANISTPGNLQVPEEILEKSQKGCSESDFGNGKYLQSAADSAGKATLNEDISQLQKDTQVIQSAFDSLPGSLKDAEGSLEKASKGCSENELEKGFFLHSAAETVEVPSLGDHISTTRDIQPMILGVPESSLDVLQNVADLDLIVPDSEDISDPEDVSSSFAGSVFNGHNSCSKDDTELILGPTKSQEDNIQIQPMLDLKGTAGSVLLWLARKVLVRVLDCLYPSESEGISLDFAKQVFHKVCIIQGITPTIADHQGKGVEQVQNMLVNKLSPTKVVITHPITKEVIVLASPTRSQSSVSSPTSTVPVSTKTQQNQIKRAKKKAKKQRLAEKKVATNDKSEFDGLDNYHYKFTLDSEDEACTGTSILKHSRLHPTYKERKERDTSLDYLDLHGVCQSKNLRKKSKGNDKRDAPSKEAEEDIEAKERVEQQHTPKASQLHTSSATPATQQQKVYTLEEMVSNIIEKLNLPKYAEKDIDIYNTVPAQIAKLHKTCPWNDRAVNIVVDYFIEAINWNTPDTKPPKEYQDYLRTIKKDKIRKDMLEPSQEAKSVYNLRSKTKKTGKESSYTKFYKENFVPP